jgi:hypothetical protein
MHLSGLVSMNVRADLSCLVSTDWVALWLVAATAFCLLFLLLFLLVCAECRVCSLYLTISSVPTVFLFALLYPTLLFCGLLRLIYDLL